MQSVAQLGDLIKHEQTLKHIAASKSFSSNRQQTIPFQPIDICTKEQRKKTQLCLYVAVHTSIASVNHLSDLHKETSFNISLHRTKCTHVNNNMIGPYFYEALIKDIGDGYYSLLIEYIDIMVNKMLGIAIRYYNVKQKIVSTFLNLIDIEDGTAKSIINAIKEVLINARSQLVIMQGIGIDNASTMIGANSGVYVRLKDVPYLILIRCVCHSLQLVISKYATSKY